MRLNRLAAYSWCYRSTDAMLLARIHVLGRLSRRRELWLSRRSQPTLSTPSTPLHSKCTVHSPFRFLAAAWCQEMVFSGEAGWVGGSDSRARQGDCGLSTASCPKTELFRYFFAVKYKM